MTAPGSLYGEGAQLLGGAAQTSTQTEKLKQDQTDTLVQSGDRASANLTGERTAISAQQATLALEKLRQSENQVQITPQIALGLAKNTGDKEWMKSVGQTMRPDVLLGLYTHGMTLASQKRSPKITQIYDQSGKIRHAVVYTDEEGNMQSLMLDTGITPEALNKGKGGGRRGGKGSDPEEMDFKQKREFNRAYEKMRKEYADPINGEMVQKNNPDKYAEDVQWLKDNRDRYDENVRAMGKGQSSAHPAPAGGGSAPANDAPFDADSFIKDALGQ